MSGYIKISKEVFYKSGAFANPRNVRVAHSGDWEYFRETK